MTHVYQPGRFFLPFGIYDADDIVKPRGRQLRTRSSMCGDDRPCGHGCAVVRLLTGARCRDVNITGTRTAPERPEA
jgi:hypothetical protein